ncbi:MAG: excinuclease ABC subunit UvrC [Mucinivorans sp.]
MTIGEKVSLLPTSPGVYQFLDSSGTIIYVGKAKSLRHRVSSYFAPSADHPPKVQALVRQVVDIRHTVVSTEQDALLLENNLIKELQPHYNILLKDAKSYPWICISQEPFPRIFSTRRFIKSVGEYYGPYSSISTQRTVLELIKGLFPIRSCHLNLGAQQIARGKYSLCLEYHIGQCRGGCVGKESEQEYGRYIVAAREILKGDLSLATDFFGAQMVKLSAQLKFEQAEKVKNKLRLLEDYSHRSVIVSPTLGSLDTVYILSDQGLNFCNHLRVRQGAIISSYTFELRALLDETPQELLAFALSNIESLSGREVVVPFLPTQDDEQLSIRLTVPQRGDKLRLLELSERNCRLARLEKLKYMEKSDPEQHTTRLMNKMRTELGLNVEPRHIECFDNSNIQGSSPVASCVVFRDGRPSKKEYRHFNIKTVVGADDFASMQEIVFRRYRRLLDEGGELPQIVLIDGGKGQLGSAVGALTELGFEDKVQVIGIAKRMEELFFAGHPEPLCLDKRGETLRTLMHLRDEAHRFGITFHRQKRSLAFLRSSLEDIPKLGDSSIDKLLKKYHTIARMKKASQQELAELIGAQRALSFIQYFQDK